MLVLTCILVDFSRHPSVFTALKKPMSSNRSRIEFLGRIESFWTFYPSPHRGRGEYLSRNIFVKDNLSLKVKENPP
jgi:hypothetical protein